MKSGKKRGNWMLTVTLAGLAVGYLLLFYSPSQRALGRLHQDLTTKQDFVAQTDALLPAVRLTEQQLDKALRYNARWIDAASSESELPRLFGKINALSKAAGIHTTRFDPQPPVQYEKIRSVSIAVGYTGQFGQLSRFLSDLESLPQTIWVQNLQFEAGAKYGKDVHCELTLAVFVDKTDESDQVKGSG